MLSQQDVERITASLTYVNEFGTDVPIGNGKKCTPHIANIKNSISNSIYTTGIHEVVNLL